MFMEKMDYIFNKDENIHESDAQHFRVQLNYFRGWKNNSA